MNLPRPHPNAKRLDPSHASRFVSKVGRRLLWSTCFCLALLLIGLGSYRSNANKQSAQGALEVDQVIDATRRAQALWSATTGYASLAGRTYHGVSSWGATTDFEALPGSAGLSFSIAFSNREQCRGAVRSASTFFDQIFIDAKPQQGSQASSDACGTVSQNALRLVKLERREIGSNSPTPQAFAPRPALAATPRQIDQARAAREAPAPGSR